MKKSIKLILGIFVMLFFIAGCHDKASETKIIIEGPSTLYEDQLAKYSTNQPGNVKWETSDHGIAYMDGDTLHAIREGLVQIDVLVGGKVVASKNIEILPARTLKITGPDYILVNQEATLELSSNYPILGGEWSSTDEGIATVTNGIIRATGVGTGEIKFTINNQEAIFTIDVRQDLSPNRIEIKELEEVYYIRTEPYYLFAQGYPEYLPQDFSWEVMGDKATIDSSTGMITIKDEGEIYVICRSAYSNYVFKAARLMAKYPEGVDVVSILFIGNSLTYVNDIPKTVKLMAQETKKSVRVNSVTAGGNTLSQLFSTKANEIQKILSTQDVDYMIIQEASAANFTNRSEFLESVAKFKGLADEYNVELRLYETWCYSTNSEWLNSQKMSREQMQELITYSYEAAHQQSAAAIHPVGRIFYEFSLDYPDLILYMDQNHASPIGSYLSSCVHYISLFQESVVGNLHDVKIDPKTKLLIEQYVTEKMLEN